MLRFNGENIHVRYFSNTECRIEDIYKDIRDKNVVELLFETDWVGYKINEDLMNLLFVSSELKRHGKNATLVLYSMPYQRMDRKCGNDIYTLGPVCEYINWLGFEEVVVVDPHSSATLELLNNVRDIYPLIQWLPKVKEEIGFTKDDYIVFPDEGAARRYDKYDLDANICFCKKRRNEISNHIVESKVISGHVKPGSKCIIVDDLCSTGGTLLKCCNLLKEMGVGEVYVIITHCEAKALTSPILDKDSSVIKMFTSRSNMSKEHDKIEYLDINIF